MKALFSTLLILLVLSTSPGISQHRGHSSSRVRYSGSRHTESHGGHFTGGRGSSHRGGHYRNIRTGNRYGRHR